MKVFNVSLHRNQCESNTVMMSESSGVQVYSSVLADICICIVSEGRGSVVVKALCCKPESWVPDPMRQIIFFFKLPNPSAPTRPWGSLSL
jgi:hypothetical protein